MLAIFDMSAVNIERYNAGFLKRHTEQYIAYVDDPDCCDDFISANATLVCTAGWSVQRIIKNFKEQNISVVMISGQRPADFRIILAANTLNIPSIYKMHGLYVAKVKRNTAFYFLSMKKVIRTFGYLINIGNFTKQVRIPIGILLSFIFGFSRKPWMIADILQVDHCLVWSEYWRPWHEQHWFMSPRKGWTTIGNPDTVKFSSIKMSELSVCYVYQTLVEDGRIPKKMMEDFYDELAVVARNKKINISVKWHARGDASARERLESRGFSVYEELPLAKAYIGHFSSLLGVVPLVDSALIVFELEGHPTPKPIRQCATIIVNDIKSLEAAISSSYVLDESKKKKAEYYFGAYYSGSIEYNIVSQYMHY